MIFNKHYEFGEEDHAFLSPSRPHWINYDDETLAERFDNWGAARKGTRLHAYAKEAILLGRKQPKNHDSVNEFINDAIGYRMTPEQILFYSENCFGTADAISFHKNLLRIHDLKTGLVTPGKMLQLEVYAALFCLEYEVNPKDIDIELRIYQYDEIQYHLPDSIDRLMEIIILRDRQVESMK